MTTRLARAALGLGLSLVAPVVPVVVGSAIPAPVASPAALDAALRSSVSVRVLSNDAKSQVRSIDVSHPLNSTGLQLALAQNCFSSLNRTSLADPKPCIFGNPRASTTVVMFGSSAVDDWTPALKIAATRLNIRVATFQFEGCFTPFVSGLDRDCTTFHRNLPAAIAKLHPSVVIAVAAADSAGDLGDARYISGMAQAFAAVGAKSPSARRVLWGTTPRMAMSVPACLLMRPAAVQSCGLQYAASDTKAHSYGQILRRDVQTAQRASATLVPVSSWFCTATQCPPIVAGIVVYPDFLHVTASYSRYLSSVVTQQLSTLTTATTMTTAP